MEERRSYSFDLYVDAWSLTQSYCSFGDMDIKADGKPVVICTPNGAGIDDWKPYEMNMEAKTWLIVASCVRCTRVLVLLCSCLL